MHAYDCNFADDVCVWVMSTLSWTCPQNRGHMDGLNVGSISCYFMLQVTNLGVRKCTLCMCVMILPTPHMYSGCNLYSAQTLAIVLQPLQMLMFFWASVFYKNGHRSCVCAVMNIKIGANWSLQPALFIAFFSLQLDTWIKSYDVLSETPQIL